MEQWEKEREEKRRTQTPVLRYASTTESLKVTGQLVVGVVGVVGLVRVRACPEKSGRDQHAGVQSVCVVLLGERKGAFFWLARKGVRSRSLVASTIMAVAGVAGVAAPEAGGGRD